MTTTTSFFSRDTMLKRQAHICRGRSFTAGKPAIYPEPNPLNIIVEEDESRSSSPSSSHSINTTSSEDNTTLDIKARRRHATVSVSDIRLSQVLPVHDDDSLLSSPRPAPKRPTTYSPLASPDSFRLTFPDASFNFPYPPIPTPTSFKSYLRHADLELDSPTHSSSSSSLPSSPGSQTEAMPLTPSTSDDEFSPSIKSRRPVIQPLVITKHNPRPFSLFDDECPISPSLLQPFKTSSENLTQSSAPLSPLSPSYLPEKFGYDSDEACDSEPESDSEWYTREFSKIISLRSPLLPSFPLHHAPARPDSMSISSAEFSLSGRRVSKPLPPTPLSGGFPSAQLDPTYPRSRRGSKRISIPKYPPPAIPTIHVQPSPTASTSSRRPPPRSSIPDDIADDAGDVEDSASAFSFSIYDVYLGGEPDGPTSPLSSYSQSSFDDPIDEVTFDLDYTMMLPLSLPGTPFDLEADIAQGLEQLRNSPVDIQAPVCPAVANEVVEKPEIREPEQEQVQPEVVVAQQPQQVFDDVFSPSSPTFPSHTDSPTIPYINEDKNLKSRWSTSTLGSIREEHERRGASAKLRLYFAGHSPLKNNKQGTSTPKKTTSPISSLSSLSPLSRKSPATLSSPSPTTRSRNNKAAHVRGYSDVLVIGYGNNGNNGGVRRRGSVTNSVSDAGSEESSSSTSSSGLRRKPIPVEMFLRSAV